MTLRYLHPLLAAAALAVALVAVQPAQAQLGDDLYLYGFFQGQYRYSQEEGLENLGSPDEISSFSLQQLNAFLMKDFNASFSAFVNAEITNSFATDRGWGTLRIEEAWVRYNQSSKFNVKAGLLVPTFNNLNEIKNRTPLLPYIFRPVAYESSFASIVNVDGFAPGQANLQVNGALPLGPVRFDYAAYVGNNSADFSARESVGSVTSGSDLSTEKLLGGRAGLRWRSLKAGVSASRDQRRAAYDIAGILNDSEEAIAQFGALLGQPIDAITPEMLAVAGIPAGFELDEVPRTRLGADLSFYRGGFFGEAEVIRVLHDLSDEHEALLAQGSAVTNGYIREGIDMSFIYGLLGYNFTDKLFGYGYYYYEKDDANAVQAAGLDVYSLGAGYRPIDGVVVKAQYLRGSSRDNPVTVYKTNSFLTAVSVSF